MRVAFYTPWIRVWDTDISGDHTLARGLLAALESRGHVVKVVSEFKTKRFTLRSHGLAKIRHNMREAARVAREFGPDVWLTYTTQRDSPDLLGPRISRLLGIPYVIYQAPHKTLWNPVRRREARMRDVGKALPGYALNRFALSRADRVIANKAKDYDVYARRPRLRKRLTLLWPAVSLQDFCPDEGARSRVRRDLGVDQDTCLILAVARLDDKKGIKKTSTRFLIDSVRELVKAGESVKLVVVGEGVARAELQEHARDLGDAAVFTGRVEHEAIAPWYNASDIFAYPGLREAIGIVYLEAQACGVPVVAFRNGALAHIVLDGETGLLVDPMDLSGFVACLHRLARDRELRHAMGLAARRHVQEHHDLDGWAIQLEETLTAARERRAL